MGFFEKLDSKNIKYLLYIIFILRRKLLLIIRKASGTKELILELQT